MIHQILLKKTELANLKSDVKKLEFDKLKNVPNNSRNLKSKVDKLDIGKLETTPVSLSKLSKKKTSKKRCCQNSYYNELIEKVNNISTTDTSSLVKRVTITKTIMK